MSIEAAIYDILKAATAVTALVGGEKSPRIYPLGIPKGKPMPAIVYQQITSSDEITTGGHIEPRDDLVQVTCWDDDPDGARALVEVVRTAMAPAAGSYGSVTVRFCSFDDEGDVYEPPKENESLERFGKRQDWLIAYET